MTLLPLGAEAATIKAGQPCKKAGQIAVVNKVQFTCVKSGKKLVWSKGIKLAAPTPSPYSSSEPTPSPSPSPTSSIAKNAWSKAEVAQHNKQSDCWSYMGEKVYNLTPWISEHPGGAEIMLEMCGKDGSESFGSHHKNEVDAYLAQYVIGTLLMASA